MIYNNEPDEMMRRVDKKEHLDFKVNQSGPSNADHGVCQIWSGPSRNSKMSSYQYRDPHVKDKIVSRLSYL